MATESKIIKEEIGINSEFGPIKEPVKLDILPLTVFIGPQGTGKSLISQLLYFFREVKYLLARLPDRKNANHAVRKMVESVRAGEQTHKAFAPFLTKNVHISYTRWYETSSLERKLSFRYNNYLFETHDTNLLSPRFFRRDQIWFAEKNQQGATDLFCLAAFKLENEESVNDVYKREYFQGRYGAIPLIGEFALAFEKEARHGN